MAQFANIIVDISLEKLDKTFQYLVPDELSDKLQEGMKVDVPFGNRKLTGYILELTDMPEFDVSRMKSIIGIAEGSIAIESRLISLAAWMRRNYGGTMNQALKTVIPIKNKSKAMEHKTIELALPLEEARMQLAVFESKHQNARARLLRELIENEAIDYTLVTQKLNVNAQTIRAMAEKGILRVVVETTYRNPIRHLQQSDRQVTLNASQQSVVDQILTNVHAKLPKTYLLKGVTGSGKTEVYMELIADCIASGKQAIVLIPEIALTYQTVMRFYQRFGNQVSILNSRMTPAERYDQFERAKKGDISIMIGPRSALFTPFSQLGLIIIDEEHENSYKSETIPRYHARETAIERARSYGASVVLGSATPSVESYYHAKAGEYELLEMRQRVKEKALPTCEIVDLREELRMGNRSIFSRRLHELIEDRLRKGQQTMLFLNRRGMAGFVSCRACGDVIKCPHCDVSLSQHNNGKMICHYCGYEMPQPKVCPTCGSSYIGGFKAGTQKIEELVQKEFPGVRTLRMDYDTTRTKDSYEKILSAFANQEADVLIGTQMIVKGHDFPNVTLVGVLAADMSLHVSDYHASERTFQLLTQAAGRAGRGEEPGEVVIQSYSPDNYAIQTARDQDYESFYEREILFRRMMHYPPVWHMMVIWCASAKETELERAAEILAKHAERFVKEKGTSGPIQIMGPVDPTIKKVNDIYRKVIYIKTAEYDRLVQLKDQLESSIREESAFRNTAVQFDFNPMSGF